MNGFSRRSTPGQSLRWGMVLLGLVMFLGGDGLGTAVRASTIRTHAHATVESRTPRVWSSFLAGGPSLWARVHAPPVTLRVREAMEQALAGANPRSNPWVEYLLWRHNLNPARFDRWHPFIGPALERLPAPQVTVGPQRVVHNPTTPPHPSRHPKGPAPQVVPPSIPEPSTWALALMAIGTGGLWRRRIASEDSPSPS